MAPTTLPVPFSNPARPGDLTEAQMTLTFKHNTHTTIHSEG